MKAGVEVSFLKLTKRGDEAANKAFDEKLRGFGVNVDEVHFGGRDNATLIPRIRDAVIGSRCDLVHSHLIFSAREN